VLNTLCGVSEICNNFEFIPLFEKRRGVKSDFIHYLKKYVGGFQAPAKSYGFSCSNMLLVYLFKFELCSSVLVKWQNGN
jgi:hypothetical protein